MATLTRDIWKKDGSKRVSGLHSSGVKSDHVTPTEYDCYGGDQMVEPKGLSWDIPNSTGISQTSNPRSFAAAACNKAWADLVEKARDNPASLGESVAQMGEAMGMIGDRLMQMAKAYTHLRRGRFRPFLRTLGIGAKRKHRNWVRNAPSQASGLWLEYSFGWRPLCKDVNDARTVLSKELPTRRYYGHGSENRSYAYTGYNPISVQYRCRVNNGATVVVDNPNLYLASQLGLANPAAVLWAVIPFSFMVDWALDISAFLESYTDFLGCSVSLPFTSVSIRIDERHVRSYNGATTRLHTWKFHRYPYLVRPVPNWHFLANIGQSKMRAANAASLLVQSLSK